MEQIEFTIFTDKYRTLQQTLDLGREAALLRNSPAFTKAVHGMYEKLTLQEDSLIGLSERSNRDKNTDQRHYSMMRALLTDFVLTLDQYVAEAEMVQESETNNMEESY